MGHLVRLGTQGTPGVAGAVGPAGSARATGTTGATGPQGATGATGITGALGPIGPTGVAGPVGAAGAQGTQGVAGAVGSPGPTGGQGSAGPQGTQGPQGAAGTIAAPLDYSFYYGTGFKAGVGTIEVGGTYDRNQIDMTSVTSVRFVLTVGTAVLPGGSYAQAQYTPDGTNWFPLSGETPVTTPNGLYSSGWEGLPNAANGDYMVRIVVFNAGSVTAQIALHQLHLQFK